MVMSRVNIAIVGSGAAGLAAAVSASDDGASVLLIEREARPGGRLNQIIDNRFELENTDNLVSGPELVFARTSVLRDNGIAVLLQTHVLGITSVNNAFQMTLSNRHGIMTVDADKVILATGAYEQPPSQLGIHGNRLAGVFTAGSAQHYINIFGQLPAKNAVILGSGNIALNLARRLSLEGAKVLGVYEPMDEPQATPQTVSECLDDFKIPLHLNHIVTRTLGSERLRAVEVFRTNKNGDPIYGTGGAVKCDSLFLSMNLISETELAESLGLKMCPTTNAPICDQNGMTSADGVFTCGNAAFISTNSSLISEHGFIVGLSAARYSPYDRKAVKINASKNFLTFLPQCISIRNPLGEVTVFFRVDTHYTDKTVRLLVNSVDVCAEEFARLRPQETYSITAKIESELAAESKFELRLA